MNDPTGTYGFAYGNMGRLIGTTTQYAFLAGTFTNAYTYDAASNRTGFTAPDGSTTDLPGSTSRRPGSPFFHSYDTLNRLSGLANSWAGSFGFSYDALSRRTQMTRPNGITTYLPGSTNRRLGSPFLYSYDSLSRLLSVLHQAGAGTIDGAVYTVDAAGNRVSKADQLAGVTSNYAYDAIYELLQVAQGANTTESYSYDPVGNRLSSLGVSPYSYNPSNEMVSTPTAMYVYDSNGNMTSKTDSTGTTQYTWDYENRLASVTLPGSGGAVSFKYDPMGRRIYKSSSSSTSVFAYDGDSLIEEANSSGTAVARYAQTRSIDEPLAMLRSGATSYYEQDSIGSVTSLSNAAGAVAQTYTYDSFGNTTNSSGSLTSFFRYTGREFDTETNLYYNRARQLDPNTGRFLSEDPVGYRGGTNFYDYARNNPANLVDPLGLSPICTWVGSSELDVEYTATRRYTTPWVLAFDPETGGSDLGPPGGRGVLAPDQENCVWRRNYVRKVWQSTLYLNTYLCVDHLACGLNLVWFQFSTDWKTKYIGEESEGTDTIVTSAWSLLGFVECTTPGMGP